MRCLALGAAALLALTAPALARSHHPRHPSRGAMYGTPIVAGSSEVRVTNAGEVISTAPPVSDEEREATTIPAKQPPASNAVK